MPLIISLGSNVGNRIENLSTARKLLSKNFHLNEVSKVYQSEAVDYLEQPEFLNQILIFELPEMDPLEVLSLCLGIELKMGRRRLVDKGPRVIDIDILFWDLQTISLPGLQVPHPRLFERSFIVLPLSKLKYFNTLKKQFDFPENFSNEAFPFNNA